MSGHNKWAQIKRKKAVTDKRRAQVFAKLSRLITIAATKGADPKNNPQLAQAFENARAENMPRDNIERAIKKVSDKSASQLEELKIDAIGPGGIGFHILAITDNRNRTIAEIKKILHDHDAKLVTPGSIAWMFQKPRLLIQDESVASKVEGLMSDLDDHDDIEDVDITAE